MKLVSLGRPDLRFLKAEAVLKPHGYLAVVSTPVVVPEDAGQFWWDVQDDWITVGVKGVDPATKHPKPVDDLGSAVSASGLFGSRTSAPAWPQSSRRGDQWSGFLRTSRRCA